MIITNELEPLSNDLTKITTEIKTYQSIGGQAIFEIGRRLNWVKEHDLAHGEFGKWLESIHMNQSTANKFMKIVTELGNSEPVPNLGWHSLYLIATMPVEERSKPQKLSSGKVKKPDEMTVRELQEVKRKLKQREQELADKDAQIADQQAELEDNRKTQLEMSRQIAESNKHQPEPKVITKTVTKEVPVKPDDYDELKANVARLQRQKDDAAKQLDEANEKLRDYEDIDKQNRKAEHWKSRGRLSVYQISSHITDFLAANTLLSEDKEAACDAGDEALASYDKKLDDLQKWIDDQRNITSGRRTVEGEIINEH